jgi:hypothetical protein
MLSHAVIDADELNFLAYPSCQNHYIDRSSSFFPDLKDKAKAN